jgi:hypothetical protein
MRALPRTHRPPMSPRAARVMLRWVGVALCVCAGGGGVRCNTHPGADARRRLGL